MARTPCAPLMYPVYQPSLEGGAPEGLVSNRPAAFVASGGRWGVDMSGKNGGRGGALMRESEHPGVLRWSHATSLMLDWVTAPSRWPEGLPVL